MMHEADPVPDAEAKVVDADRVLAEDIFSGVPKGKLKPELQPVVERRFEAGDIIFREGDYGSTAFYILQGTVEVFLATSLQHVVTEAVPPRRRWHFTSKQWKRTSKLVHREEDQREATKQARSIPVDASIDLPYDNPRVERKAGDLFGESSCLNGYPRGATVRATSDCVLWEMRRHVYRLLRATKEFKERREAFYREKALYNHLRTVPLFDGVSDTFIRGLLPKVELLSYEPGQVICRQDDLSDSFYLVRGGFVKISERYQEGERTLAYLHRADYFGEISLLGGGAKRTATCTALDHVEVARIWAEDFDVIVERFPDIRENLMAEAEKRRNANLERLQTLHDVPLDIFLAEGLMEARNLLLLDLDRCTRCDECVRACADSHDGITRLVREGIRFSTDTGTFLVATSCRQCRDPVCMVCPVGAISRGPSGEILIEDWCIGCNQCAEACPYDNINLHVFPSEDSLKKQAVARKKATTCDLCPGHDEPNCVYACPHDAALRVDPQEFFAGLLKRSPRPPPP